VLYEIIPADSAEAVPGVDALKYQQSKLSEAAKSSPELLTVKLRYKQPDGHKSTLLTRPLVDTDAALASTSDNFRWSAAVAAFGMVLRDSKYKGQADYGLVKTLAKGALAGGDAEGYRFEFMQLVQKAELL